MLRKQYLKRFIPLARHAHKNTAGHIWIFGGSVGFTGAPRLVARGAFAATAGLVSICCPAQVYNIIATACLETMVHAQTKSIRVNELAKSANVIVAGPGWGLQQQQCLAEILQSKSDIVLDADALNMLAIDNNLRQSLIKRQHQATGICVLTPHPGEAARLLDCSTAEVQANRIDTATSLAQEFACTVILKGANSLIAIASFSHAKPAIYQCPFGSPSLAIAGSGDILAGILAALLVRHGNEAACLAVLLHALAGERMERDSSAWLASDIASMVRKELLDLLWEKKLREKN
ncbi:MAG: NAD(P)H-hydrate dehydratase [Mariprofundales bacterium]